MPVLPLRLALSVPIALLFLLPLPGTTELRAQAQIHFFLSRGDVLAITSPLGGIPDVAFSCLVIDSGNNLYGYEAYSETLWKITRDGQLVEHSSRASLLAAIQSINPGLSTLSIRALAANRAGELLAYEGYSHSILKIGAGGSVSVWVQPADLARPAGLPLADIFSMAIDDADRLYAFDKLSDAVLKISESGIVSLLLSGDQIKGLSGASLVAISAMIWNGSGKMLAFDNASKHVFAFTPAGSLQIWIQGQQLLALTGKLYVEITTMGRAPSGGIIAFDRYADVLMVFHPEGTARIFASTERFTEATGFNAASVLALAIDRAGTIYAFDNVPRRLLKIGFPVGDFNFDGRVDSLDLLILSNYLVGNILP